MTNLINVRIENDRMITDSRNVADVFSKRHDNVIRDIENLKKDVLNFEEMFFKGTMPDSYGREQKVYFMTRDGFTLLAMGFTGKDAMQWKLRYIEAFNKLAEAWNSPEAVMARALQIANKKLDEAKMLIAAKDEEIAEMKPKVSYYDVILNCKDLVSVTQIAKDYGKSAKWLNEFLSSHKIQYKQGDQWFLYQKYADKGYAQSKTQSFAGKDGEPHSKAHTYWTQDGRRYIYELLKSEGILPVVELE